VIRAALRASLVVPLWGALAAGGCKKDQQSLALVSLKLRSGTTAATNLKSVTLSATPGPMATFDQATLSADTAVKFGLYLSGSITGDVSIVASAAPKSGCGGFRGSGLVTIDGEGVTRSVDITMEADNNICAPGTGGGSGQGGSAGSAGAGGGQGGSGGTVGGQGGSAGSAGAGGSNTAGTGGTGTAGTGGSAGRGGAGGTGGTTGTGGMAGYPSITSCRTFAHATGTCPNTYVKSVAISPNGQIVASAGDDGRVKIWSFDGRQLTATSTVLTGFTGDGVAFSPDGTKLAHASTNGTVKTYTVSGWAAGPTLQDDGSHNTIRGVAFTPDGQRVVSVNAIGFAGGDIFVHNLGGSTLPALTAHVANEPYSLAVSPRAATDGSVGVAVGSYYGTAAFYALGASAISSPLTINTSVANRTTYSVRFSPDGSQLAMGEDYGVVRFFASPVMPTPAPIGNMITFAGGDSVNDIAFSPNGKYVAIGGAFSVSQLSIYDAMTHAEIERVAPEGDIDALVFAPNGNAIIAGTDMCSYVLVCN